MQLITHYQYREIPRYDSILFSNLMNPEDTLNLIFVESNKIGLTSETLKYFRKCFSNCNQYASSFVQLHEFIQALE